jgi:hypothetical protein
MTAGDYNNYTTGIPTYQSGYYRVMAEEVDPFKRLIAWKGLKIRSISILGNTISIECYKGRKTYFVTIDEDFVKVFNNKKEVIDTVPIPKVFKYQPNTVTTSGNTWIYPTTTTTVTGVKWRDSTTLDPKWTTTSNNTAAGYKISFE